MCKNDIFYLYDNIKIINNKDFINLSVYKNLQCLRFNITNSYPLNFGCFPNLLFLQINNESIKHEDGFLNLYNLIELQIDLTNNINLKQLYIKCNILSIDISKNINLNILEITSYILKKVHLTNNVLLDTLILNTRDVDISNNNNLIHVELSNIDNLKINIEKLSNLNHLLLNFNKNNNQGFNNFDFSKNSNLNYLKLINNIMEKIDLSKCINLESLYIINDIYDKKLNNLDQAFRHGP